MHNEMQARRTALVGLVMAAVSLAACGGTKTRYIHPNADLGAIKKVAVLPFENLSQDQTASERVQSLFLVELLSKNAFEVVEPGQVKKVLQGARIQSTASLGPGDFKALGEELVVDGFFLGTVVDFGAVESGSSTLQVTIQLRLVEAASGATVWSASESSGGSSFWRRMFGVEGKSLSEVASELLRRELGSLVD